MACCVQSTAHSCDVRLNARGGFVMRRQNGFDLVTFVGGQDFFIAICRNAFAPRGFHNGDIQSVTLAHVDPAMREHAVARGKDFVACGQRVGQGRFPAARATGREDKDLSRFAFQDLLHALACRVQDLTEQRRAMVDRRHVRRLAQAFGDVGRARNENGVLKTHGVLLRH